MTGGNTQTRGRASECASERAGVDVEGVGEWVSERVGGWVSLRARSVPRVHTCVCVGGLTDRNIRSVLVLDHVDTEVALQTTNQHEIQCSDAEKYT
jgi:hypothetical protein